MNMKFKSLLIVLISSQAYPVEYFVTMMIFDLKIMVDNLTTAFI